MIMAWNLCRCSAVAAVTALVIAASPYAASAGGAECVNDWSKAARVVSQEGLIGVERLLELAASAYNGAIVRTTLCRDGDRYVYRILVRDRNGQLSKHIIDASQPPKR